MADRETIIETRSGGPGILIAVVLAVLAVLAGARLTGATALRSYGIWNGFDLRTHLQLRPNSCPTQQDPLTTVERFQSPKFASTGMVRHWAPFTASAPGHPCSIEPAAGQAR